MWACHNKQNFCGYFMSMNDDDYKIMVVFALNVYICVHNHTANELNWIESNSGRKILLTFYHLPSSLLYSIRCSLLSAPPFSRFCIATLCSFSLYNWYAKQVLINAYMPSYQPNWYLFLFGPEIFAGVFVSRSRLVPCCICTMQNGYTGLPITDSFDSVFYICVNE